MFNFAHGHTRKFHFVCYLLSFNNTIIDKEMNEINWQEAFEDENFMTKLRNTIEEAFTEHTATEEDLDEMMNSIFGYDKKTETLSINKNAVAGTIESNISNDVDNDGKSLTDDENEDYSQKIRMRLLLSLMIDNGLVLETNNMTGDKSKSKKQEHRGNGAKAAMLINRITGIPLQTCKNFITNPIISFKAHKDKITSLNAMLIDMGMKVRI